MSGAYFDSFSLHIVMFVFVFIQCQYSVKQPPIYMYAAKYKDKKMPVILNILIMFYHVWSDTSGFESLRLSKQLQY